MSRLSLITASLLVVGSCAATQEPAAENQRLMEAAKQAKVSLVEAVGKAGKALGGTVILARDNLRNQQETLDLTAARVRGGLAADVNAVRARTSVETTRAAIPLLEQERLEALNALRVLLGEHAGSWTLPPSGVFPCPQCTCA